LHQMSLYKIDLQTSVGIRTDGGDYRYIEKGHF